MNDLLNLSNEDLKDIGVNKLKYRKLIMQETQKMREGRSSLVASAKEKVPEITVSMHVLLCRYRNILSKQDGTADSYLSTISEDQCLRSYCKLLAQLLVRF